MAPSRPQLAALLERVRLQRGYSQANLAYLCGMVNQSTVQRWLNGRTIPNECYQILLADALQLPLEELAAADQPDAAHAQAAHLRLLTIRDQLRGTPPTLTGLNELYEQAIRVRVAGAVRASLELTGALIAWVERDASRAPAYRRAALNLKARIWDEQGWARRDLAAISAQGHLAAELSQRLRAVWEPLDDPEIYGRDLIQQAHAWYLRGSAPQSITLLEQARSHVRLANARLALEGVLVKAAAAATDRRLVERQVTAIERWIAAPPAPLRQDMVCMALASIAQASIRLHDGNARARLDAAWHAYAHLQAQDEQAPLRKITLSLLELELRQEADPAVLALATEATQLAQASGYQRHEQLLQTALHTITGLV